MNNDNLSHKNLKYKIIRDNLTIATIELGSTRVIDLISDICMKIYESGGSEIESLGIMPDKENWKNDSKILKKIRDSGDLNT